MLRKAEEHLTNQRQHEAENMARLEAARRKRQEERDRQEALEVSSNLFPSRLRLHHVVASTNGRVTS